MRVGIIGCGKIADSHAFQIQKIKDAEIVGVCDQETLMARQMAERFRVRSVFADAGDMLKTLKPDVVHITTPPQSHYSLGKMCLESGSHVYMEKPFTLYYPEAKELIELAEKKSLKIIAGHNAQFSPAMVRMRELVKSGYLGGKPVHMECHYCYDLSDEGYAKSLLGDDDHWVRKLPGSLLQNIISHGISKIAEFLSGENPTVIAHGFTSPFLKKIGENKIIDELRVIIRDDEATTAYFTFSSQIKPAPRNFFIYGPKNSLIVDEDHQTVIRIDNRDDRSYLRYINPPSRIVAQYLGNVYINIRGIMKREIHLPNDSAMKTLIEAFYRFICGRSASPMTAREIRLTAKIMDEIFSQFEVH